MSPPVTTGLLLCLQASSYAVADGAVVGNWTDQSAAGNNATVAGSPRWYEGLTPNGRSGLQFAADGDFTFSNNTMFSGATSGELFFVVKSNSGNTQGPFCFGGNDNNYYPFSDAKQYDGSFTNSRYSWTAPTPTKWHIYNVSHDGTTRISRLDGATMHTQTVVFTAPHSSTKSTLRIGHGGSSRFSGQMAEALAYSRSLTSGERSDVYNYLYDLYLAAADSAAPPVTSGLALHLQADAFAGTDNQMVRGGWVDVSGTANHGVSVNATRQRTVRTPLGGRSVQFLGGSSGGYYTLTNNAIYSGTTAGELFLVTKSNSSNSPGPWAFGGGAGSDGFFPHPSGVGGDSIFDGCFQATGTRRNFANPGVTTWGIYNVSHDGTTKTCRWNSVVADTATVGYVAPGSTILTVGWPPGVADKYVGEIAEVLAYTRVLTSGERADVYDFLLSRHITSTTPVEVDAPTASFTLDAPAPTLPRMVSPPTALLTLAAPAPSVPRHLYPPAALFTLAAFPPAYMVEVPTAGLTLAAFAPTIEQVHVRRPPTALFTLTAPAPLLIVATATLLAPIDELLVPSQRPTFVVQVVTTDPNATLEVQYATDAGFTTPVTLTTPIAVGQDFIEVSVRATVALADETTYFWRARVSNPFSVTNWTATETFITSFVDGDGLASGGWTVSTATTSAPHLWFSYPAQGVAGDTALIFGTAFGPTTVSVHLAGELATVADWDVVAPDGDAYTADRLIDPQIAYASPGHHVIRFTVPDVDYPGGPLYVDGS